MTKEEEELELRRVGALIVAVEQRLELAAQRRRHATGYIGLVLVFIVVAFVTVVAAGSITGDAEISGLKSSELAYARTDGKKTGGRVDHLTVKDRQGDAAFFLTILGGIFAIVAVGLAAAPTRKPGPDEELSADELWELAGYATITGPGKTKFGQPPARKLTPVEPHGENAKNAFVTWTTGNPTNAGQPRPPRRP